jgi:hypothetical protein
MDTGLRRYDESLMQQHRGDLREPLRFKKD